MLIIRMKIPTRVPGASWEATTPPTGSDFTQVMGLANKTCSKYMGEKQKRMHICEAEDVVMRTEKRQTQEKRIKRTWYHRSEENMSRNRGDGLH